MLCGNSEIEQQVAMLGLDADLGRGELFGELLPALAEESGSDAVYLPSAPCGGDLPFRSDRGVANYFGVGGYRRPLEDARRAEVRFASECLAFSNVPDGAGVPVHDPRWKEGVPRDAGSGWDFEDVRDHYLELLYGVDPVELRSVDHDRYLDLSRAVTGEVMGATFTEWRRDASPCQGGLILWLRDLVPGAGWGLIDHDGEPKVALHHLRRALAPVAVAMTPEGLNGVDVHVANDRPEPLRRPSAGGPVPKLGAAGGGGRAGARAWPALRASGRGRGGGGALRRRGLGLPLRAAGPGRDRRQPRGRGRAGLARRSSSRPARPTGREPASALGLGAEVAAAGDGTFELVVRSDRLAHGVRVKADGYDRSDDAFSRRAGRRAHGSPDSAQPGLPGAGSLTLTALNLEGRVRMPINEVA